MDFDAARRRAHEELDAADAADTAARDRAAADAAAKASFEQQALALGREIAAALTAAGVPTMKKQVTVPGPRGDELVGWELDAGGKRFAPVSFCTTDGRLYERQSNVYSPLHELGSPTYRKFENGDLFWFAPAIDGEPDRLGNVTQGVQDAVGYHLAEHERDPSAPAPQPAPKKRGLFGRR
ncbi:hypothetical protein KZI27_10570 [Curtobacterium sp. TC1]|uniref:hypothetical protein n=1 Tax=Curtobacterium sp. TC1 TaxID=2862880 RepID=UPI001C9B3078|nr:hypothetical protein [Curtobacterium sp. TC1]QZQ53811.1 hypothetical protein KZI27_10570 [Curtobacterium sp. TC1]